VVEDDVATMAAALAYYFFFAIFPMLLFVLALASMLPLQGLEGWLLENARQSLPAEAYGALEQAVREVLDAPRSGLLSVGAGIALWTASAGFGALIAGLNRAYRVSDERAWWQARLYAIALTVALSVLMILAFVLVVFGGPLVDLVTRHLGPMAGVAAFVIRWAVTLASVMVLVAAIYYACPSVERSWRWIRPGSVLFTLGFLGASSAFSGYVGRFATYDRTYGSLGAIMILLLWMYLLGLFLLLGGELNALLEERLTGARSPRDRIGGRDGAERRTGDARAVPEAVRRDAALGGTPLVESTRAT